MGNAWYLYARNPAQAAEYYVLALALARNLMDWQHEAEILWCLAVTDADTGRPDEAVARASEAVELLTSRKHPHAAWFADNLRQFRAGGRDAALAQSDPLLAGAVGQLKPGAAGPGVLGMALSAAKAVSTYLGSGLKSVPPKTQTERLDVCAQCEYHTGARCRVCGCFTALKAWLPYETCPLGKWPT